MGTAAENSKAARLETSLSGWTCFDVDQCGAAGSPLAAYTQAQLRRGRLVFLQTDHGQMHRSRSDPACKVLTQCSRV
jgi:hypothetical protein